MTDKTFTPSYQQMHDAALALADRVLEAKLPIARIVALARGGLFLGVVMSHYMNLPLTVVNYSSKKGKGDDRNHDNKLPVMFGEGLLVVDDLTDTGYTMQEVCQHYERDNFVWSAVMYDKQPVPVVHEVNFAWHTAPGAAEWVVFPFEVNNE